MGVGRSSGFIEYPLPHHCVSLSLYMTLQMHVLFRAEALQHFTTVYRPHPPTKVFVHVPLSSMSNIEVHCLWSTLFS